MDDIIPHVGFTSCLFFFSSFFLFEMLEAVDTAWLLEGHSLFCMALDGMCFQEWLTSCKENDGKPCSWRRNVFGGPLVWRKGPGKWLGWNTHLCIALLFNCLFLYCQLDLQWWNYTMLVFCFIVILFLIFQNIRNFMLLYVMAEKYWEFFLIWSNIVSADAIQYKLQLYLTISFNKTVEKSPG